MGAMMDKKQLTKSQHLKEDLAEIHKDWIHLFEDQKDLDNPQFLSKMASDIQHLDQDALKAVEDTNVKEQAELIHYLLTTPWGAPFIGETTLLDAANSYQQGQSESPLKHLLSGFMQHSEHQSTNLFKFLEQIYLELD